MVVQRRKRKQEDKKRLSDMSIFSRSSGSSKGKHYREAHHGSSHYQRRGIFGNLFNLIVSKTQSGGHYDRTPRQNSHDQSANGQYTNCSCGAKVPSGANFCSNCGSKVQSAAFCSSCGEMVPAGSKFCLSCGNRIKK
jgi:hypothetical protein